MADSDELVTAPAPMPALATGEIFAVPDADRYEMLASLGEGGMGQVSLCRDRAIGREVAMKVVHPSFHSQAEMRARFVREARVQAQLEHPAIVPVYDFGTDSTGSAFFTMKRVRGVTLADIVEAYRENDRPNQEVMKAYGRHRLLAAFVQVCLAIDYAHERGILHRDLKPANVMLGAYGETYVLDWGLAKIREPAGDLPIPGDRPSARPGAGADATAAGEMIGTPGYVAPEIIRGEDADARTDVYALGGILFELLTYEPLHGTGPIDAMIARAAKGVDARPSVRAPARDVPPELEVACTQACAPSRSERLPSARALADLVEAYLSGDRDVELRRELAAVHLDRAKDAFARASVPGAALDDRRVALEEAGRAVALAPEDDRARAVLVGLLTKPPVEAPPEVLAEVEEERARSHVGLLPRARHAFTLIVLGSFVGTHVLGVRSYPLVLGALGLFVVAIAINIYAERRQITTAWTQRAFSVAAALGVAMVSVFFGPLIVVPTLAATIASSSILQMRPSARTVTAAYIAAIVAPSLFVLASMHPVHFGSLGGALTISPAAVDLPPQLTIAAVTVLHAMVVLAGCLHSASYRDAMHELAIANHLQAWQLAHLVPERGGVKMPSVAPRAPQHPSPSRRR